MGDYSRHTDWSNEPRRYILQSGLMPRIALRQENKIAAPSPEKT